VYLDFTVAQYFNLGKGEECERSAALPAVVRQE
jgi:hypothetical protein